MTGQLRAMIAAAAGPYRRLFALAALLAAAGALAAIGLLALAGWFIAGAAVAGLAGVAAVQGFNYLVPSAAIRLLAILRTVSRYGERLTGHQAALRTLASLRVALFARLVGRPVAESSRSGGDAAARLIQDVEALEDRLVRRPALGGAWAGLALGLGCVAATGAGALAAALLATGLVLAVARPAARRLLPDAADAVQTELAALKRDLVDAAVASADIAAYGLGPIMSGHLLARAGMLDEARTALDRREALLLAVPAIGGGLSVAAAIGLSTASVPVTFLAAIAMAGASEMLVALVRSTGRDVILARALGRLGEIAAEPAGLAEAERPAGSQLAFTFGRDRIVLRAGERLAVTGPSGCGKTRLLESLAGWRDDEGGAIAVDGRPARDWGAPALRPLFALAPQDAALLAGTVADNLRLARPGVDEAAMWAALDTACLAAEVRAMPQGLSSWIGDGGARLSGGQRKRLSVARALLAGRPWLLLDEPSEGLDAGTERRLCQQLGRWLDATGTGLILVTHRSAMLELADRRCELDLLA